MSTTNLIGAKLSAVEVLSMKGIDPNGAMGKTLLNLYSATPALLEAARLECEALMGAPNVQAAVQANVSKGKGKATSTPAPATGKSKSAKGLDKRSLQVHEAIKLLRKDGHKGVHAPFSGITQCLATAWGCTTAEVIEHTKAMIANGTLDSHPAKKGVMLYLPGEKPVREAHGNPDVVAALKAL